MCWFQLNGQAKRSTRLGAARVRARRDNPFSGAGSMNQYFLQACKLNLNIENQCFYNCKFFIESVLIKTAIVYVFLLLLGPIECNILQACILSK